MASSVPVVVKPLPDSRSLEGACRLHLSPETLEQAHLKLGDLCEIEAEDGAPKGFAIAWRAADSMRSGKNIEKPAKMGDMLREALQISENAHIRVKKSNSSIAHATKVVLFEVSPPEYARASENISGDNSWTIRSSYLLATCEAFTKGMSFDVSGVKKAIKKRYKIHDVQSSDATDTIYFLDDSTEICIEQGDSAPNDDAVPVSNPGGLPQAERIGGLIDQLEALHNRLQWLLEDVSASSSSELGDSVNEGILLHGFEGTGKSEVIKWLEKAPVRKVLRLTPSLTAGSTSSKVVESIRATFKAAEAHQPSLILMDDIHRLLEKNKDALVDVLNDEMSRLEGSRVLVIAVCRNPGDLDSVLTCPRRLSDFIELPIPDRAARSQILQVLLKNAAIEDELIEFAALNSHGYTGRDLDKLVIVARKNAKLRAENARKSGHPSQPSAAVSEKESGERFVAAKANSGTDQKDTTQQCKLTIENFTSALNKVRPTALREMFFEPPKIGWNDIGGSGAIKERFDKTIGYSIHHTEMMEKLHLRPAKGILLYGPPGCSKTLTAQAVASHYRLNFITVKGSEMVSMYVGESERAIRELFRKARQAAPCVIFFDEIDSIASERDTGSSKGLNVLTTLLNEMDGFEALNGVLVLAATNKPEALDPAIMRPGRFGSHVYLGPPNAAARREIFHINLRHLSGAESMDLERLVNETDGYSGAEIVQICQTATYKVAERYLQSGSQDAAIHIEDLQVALSQQKKSITSDMLASYEAFAGT